MRDRYTRQGGVFFIISLAVIDEAMHFFSTDMIIKLSRWPSRVFAVLSRYRIVIKGSTNTYRRSMQVVSTLIL